MLLSCSLCGCLIKRKEEARQEERHAVRERSESLWRDYFEDPSQWWDIRNTKANQTSPDFKHKVTKQRLWIRGPYNPCWVQEELRRLGQQPAERGGGGEFDVENTITGFYCSTQQEEVDRDEAYDKRQEFYDNNDESIALMTLMKACAQQKDLLTGIAVHSDLVKKGLLEHNAFVGSTLISMYAKCGALEEAQIVFDEIPLRNVVLWSTLIAGYAQNGHGEKALICFEQMQLGGFSPNAITFACILKACARIDTLDKGQQIHAQILNTNLLYKNVVVATALVDMYAKCGALEKAHEIFSELPVRNEVSWNALISGYTQQGYGEKALNIYELMQAQGFCPDAVTFICTFKACGSIEALDKGMHIHTQIVRECLLEENTVLAGAVVDMYAKCGAFGRAQEVFNKLQNRSVGMWNALITGYVQYGQGEKALNCYKLMQYEGIAPDAITYVCALKACSSIGAVDTGHDIHAQIVRERLLEKNIAVACTLVDMYAKSGVLEKARDVFNDVLVRSVVLWNALIGGYAQHGHDEEALECFQQMQVDGFSPDSVTFACILKACGSVGALYKGQQSHSEIATFGFLGNMVVGTALVDMYANCGMIAEAKAVFDNLLVRDVVSWGSLMVGYAQLGKDDVVFSLFDRMVGEGIEPNSITFLVVLNACNHSGLLDKGQMYFEIITKGYGIIPTLEHHNSMVDLFGRVGLLEKAIAVIEAMPFLANVTLWHTLLGACRKWGHTNFGRRAFKYAVEADRKHGAAFVCMGNICAGAAWQNQVGIIEEIRWKSNAWKKLEYSSWKDISGVVHLFSAGNNMHPQNKDIYLRLQSVACKLLEEGDLEGVRWISKDITNNEKKDFLSGQSEMLAITCALINTSERTPIHVIKNTQICGHCHRVTSLITKVEKRRISIRDAFCLHIFEDGRCFCGINENWAAVLMNLSSCQTQEDRLRLG